MFGKKKFTDPVCKMTVGKNSVSTIYQGITYYFCSEDCRREFERNPEKYIEKEAAEERNHHSSYSHCC